MHKYVCIYNLYHLKSSKSIVSDLKTQVKGLFRRASDIYLKNCLFIYLAWAKYEEDFGTNDLVHAIFKKCLNADIGDQTLVINFP